MKIEAYKNSVCVAFKVGASVDLVVCFRSGNTRIWNNTVCLFGYESMLL
jgi:hypothetical protein